MSILHACNTYLHDHCYSSSRRWSCFRLGNRSKEWVLLESWRSDFTCVLTSNHGLLTLSEQLHYSILDRSTTMEYCPRCLSLVFLCHGLHRASPPFSPLQVPCFLDNCDLKGRQVAIQPIHPDTRSIAPPRGSAGIRFNKKV